LVNDNGTREKKRRGRSLAGEKSAAPSRWEMRDERKILGVVEWISDVFVDFLSGVRKREKDVIHDGGGCFAFVHRQWSRRHPINKRYVPNQMMTRLYKYFIVCE
jgi:hypothetical protein